MTRAAAPAACNVSAILRALSRVIISSSRDHGRQATVALVRKEIIRFSGYSNCGPGCGYDFGLAGNLFQCSSYPLVTPGILYKPVTRVRHQTIGILRRRWLPYPPFPKEHARDRVAWLARRTTQVSGRWTPQGRATAQLSWFYTP